LRGKHAGLHSVSLNLSYASRWNCWFRINKSYPVNVGDHDAVYW